MAISILTASGTDTDASSYTTGSCTAGATSNAIYLAAVAPIDVGGLAQKPTAVTGMGLTWTEVDTPVHSTGHGVLSVWRSAGAASDGAVTFTNIVSAGTADGARWMVVKITEVNTTTNNGVVQHENRSASADGVGFISMVAWTDTVNNIGAAFWLAINSGDTASVAITCDDPSATLAQFDESTIGTDKAGLAFMYHVGSGPAQIAAQALAASDGLAGVGMELAAVPSGGGFGPIPIN